MASTLLVGIVGACSTEAPITEVKGSCADVYNSQVCTWARTQGDNLLEVGAAVPIAIIENSPADVPMVAKAMLMEKKSFDLVIPQIPGLLGAHPTTFQADYDATKQEYRIVLSGFASSN
jgi:hypothetical protein